MTAAAITFEVDDDLFVRVMHEASERVEDLVTAVAVDLARSLESEGGQILPKLGEGWDIKPSLSPWSRTVVAPDDAWWAHFIAHGTRDHGPRQADRLIFTVDGETVSAEQVRGITANPFDERAIARTRSHVDEILRRLLG
jgi:hypothetical protein